jgi:TolB-like protein
MSEEANRADVPPADHFTTVWRRLKDHRIAQWTVGYVAVAYGIQHAVTLTAEAFDWPHAVTRVSMLLLALGLPVAMTLAWYHGERATKRISGGEMAIVSTLLVLISLVFYVFVRPSEPTASGPTTQEASVTAARQASLSPGTAISLAVMPFENLSPDPNQVYFADGTTEEITTALARIPDLRVVARESAFAFKGKNQDVRAIGKALNATHLIEGTIRKAGDQLRISAQLVRADTGVTLWANSYDRELKDVFAVQEDIARSIATSLHMTLGLKPGENLVSERTKNTANYDDYLRAKGLVRQRGAANQRSANALLEQVVMRDPDFGPGWALLALNYALTPLGDRALDRSAIAEILAKAETAAQRAIQLDSKNPDGYATLGQIEHARGNQIAAADSFVRAMALDPANSDALHLYSNFLADAGYVKRAIPLRRQLSVLDPSVRVFNGVTERINYAGGLNDEVIQHGTFVVWMALAAKGQYGEAAAFLEKVQAPLFPAAARETAVRLLRAAPAKLAPAALPQGLGRSPSGFNTSSIYAYVGVPEMVMESYEVGLKRGYIDPGEDVYLWAPSMTAVRQTARFKSYVRAAGLVDYWRQNGWPEVCHPTTADDFECS